MTVILKNSPVFDDDLVNKAYVDGTIEQTTDALTTVYNKNWGTQPVPPYHINDTWSTDGKLYICTTERLIGNYDSADWTELINTTVYDNFIDNVYAVKDLEIPAQSDNIVETWYQTSDPSSAWGTTILKEAHNGDLWYNKTTLVQKRYKRQNTNPVTYAWETVAYPSNMFDIGEATSGHRVIFLTTPSNYHIGDFWVINTGAELPTGTEIGQMVRAINASAVYDKSHWSTNEVDVVKVTAIEDEYYKKEEVVAITTDLHTTVSSEITQAVDSLALTVSQDYTTKTDFNTVTGTLEDSIETTNTTVAQIEVTVGEISSTVTDTTTVQSNMLDNLGVINNQLTTMSETILTQASSEFQMWFAQTGLPADVANIQGMVDTNSAELITYSQYIRFVEGNIELGKSDSEVKLILQNNRISFMTGGTESAYISNNTLYITDSTILVKQQIGQWLTVEDAYNNLNTKWIGEV